MNINLPSPLSKVSLWAYIILGVLIVVLSLSTYFYYKKYSTQQSLLAIQGNIIVQNQEYYKQIKQKDDSLQTLVGLVQKLNKEKFDYKKKWQTQQARYELKIKDLESKGIATITNGSDVEGSYYQTDFTGKKGIINYEGYTRSYLSLTPPIGKHYLNVSFDPINVFSEFYRNDDGLWLLRTVSTTPGIDIKTDYRIDSLFYGSLADFTIIPEEEEIGSPEFTLRIGAHIVTSSNVQSWYYQHPFDVSAELFYSFVTAKYQPLQKAISVGVYYDVNVTGPFNFIKNILSIF